MKKEFINKQLHSYEEGLTSSAEEKELLSLLCNSEKGANAWFKFLKLQKRNTPTNLETDIWQSIQNIEQRKRRMLVQISSVAASVILVVSLFFSIAPLKKKEMSYEEKVAAIEEGLTLVSADQELINAEEILYEDENLIIYLK